MPSSLSSTDSIHLAHAKKLVWQMQQALPPHNANQNSTASVLPVLQEFFHPQTQFHCFHPVNTLHGLDDINTQFWQPLLHAMPNLERRTDLFFAGDFNGRFCGGAGTWVTSTGYLMGTMQRDWLGIPATGDTVCVRIGEFYRVEDGLIVDARILIDFVDVMRQAGYHVLPRTTGAEFMVPGPQLSDGILLGESAPDEALASMQALDRMIGGLVSFNQKDLKSMGMHAFWHKDMMWYGPCGIGTSRTVEGFQKHHQKPFLHAFPDRVGGNHISRIAQGHYIASTGWPSVHATHAGDYLGAPATHQPIHMRVADWWRREDDLLRENWVLIDLPDLLLQMGVDLFERLREQVATKK